MNIKKDSLLFKFAIIFILFIFFALSLSGINAYFQQRNIYTSQCENHLINIATHLKHLVENEGRVFEDFYRFIIAHKDQINVPIDYDGNWNPAWHDFETMFNAKYPGKTLGYDIAFTEMDEETQMTCAIYMHRKWLSIFEGAAKDFHIRHIYYLVPSTKPLHMLRIISGTREQRVVDGKKYILLCSEVYEPIAEHEKLWEVWTTGKSSAGYDMYENEWGKTYAYYTAVYLDGKKSGIITAHSMFERNV